MKNNSNIENIYTSSTPLDLRGSSFTRMLRRLSINTGFTTSASAKPSLRADGHWPFLMAASGAILGLAAIVAPAPVFSMMLSGSASAAATAQPLQAATDQKTEVFDATQVATLRGHLGEFVSVKGTPTGTGQSKTGAALYLNFSRQRGGAVTVVFFLPKGNATPASGAGTKPSSVEDLKQFVGKPVVVKGQLSDHEGDVQMILPYLEQIKAQ